MAMAMAMATTIITITTMITETALYRLMTWLSPAYPVGAFSYSHGLEYAVEAGLVHDVASMTQWIEAVLEQGAGRIDAALFVAAWRAADSTDDAALETVVELATAWRSTAETALESSAQGAAFVSVTGKVWPCQALDRLAVRHDGKLPLSVAVGAGCAAHEVPLLPSVTAFLQAFAANLVSAGVRLVPLGQTDGQRAIAALESVVARCAATALDARLEELGSAAPLLDWCSMQHETQYTRLFRS
jgi:urease accessory protein